MAEIVVGPVIDPAEAAFVLSPGGVEVGPAQGGPSSWDWSWKGAAQVARDVIGGLSGLVVETVKAGGAASSAVQGAVSKAKESVAKDAAKSFWQENKIVLTIVAVAVVALYARR